MTSLRKYARGKPCKVMLDGICNHDPDTTVLAHYRWGFFGISTKPHDILAALACSSCHDALDGRTHKDLTKRFRMAEHAFAVIRTIAALLAEGKIEIVVNK